MIAIVTFQRLIASQNVEFYRVIGAGFEDLGYLMFHDARRKSRLSDNQVLIESGMTEEEFQDYARANHIEVLFFSYFDTEAEEKQQEFRQILGFVDGMLDYKPDTTYFIELFPIEEDEELAFSYPNEFEKVSEFAQNLAARAERSVAVPIITREAFKYLTQR
ncbi:hypothetical protein [Pseudobacillus badius]|uniref:hypothetical protein n=1 Tax=Bacillus badius TaxID=1455 RepID=UPI0007B47199|nr:hypothetical protein [Bacillus badius]KZN99441.1 hypothetical protein A4244_18005 [Bacillus badius]OCS85279.1 hypothetical protein A6M11_18020 [Bacillus badius]